MPSSPFTYSTSYTFSNVAGGDLSFTNIFSSESDFGTFTSFTDTAGNPFWINPLGVQGIEWGGFGSSVNGPNSESQFSISYTVNVTDPNQAITSLTQLYVTDALPATGTATAVEQAYDSQGNLVGSFTWNGATQSSSTLNLPVGYQQLNIVLTVTETVTNGLPGDQAGISTIDQLFGQTPMSQLAVIGNNVFIDNSPTGSGAQTGVDAGPGVPGVTVNLLEDINNTFTQIASTTTDANGHYQFIANPGTYEVQFVQPAGYSFSQQGTLGTDLDSTPNQTTGITPAFVVTQGQTIAYVDAGLVPPSTHQNGTASIGDNVWLDSSGSGIQSGVNAGPGVANVTVNLLLEDSTGNFNQVATTTTNSSGLYAFDTLNAGTYEVQFLAPTGYIFSPQGAQGSDLDSTANQTTGITQPITLATGQAITWADAGLVPINASITLQKLVSVDGGASWVLAPTASGEPTMLNDNPAVNPEYEFIVTNNGNVALNNVTLGDSPLNIGTLGNIGSLDIGASDTVIATGTWAAGPNTDIANVTGTSIVNGFTSTPSATATGNYFGAAPSIALQKLVSLDGGATWVASPTVSGEPSEMSGGPAPEYEFIVSNTGNVALTSVSLSDSVTSGGAINLGTLGNIGSLGIGAVDTIVATGTWAAGQNTDTATVSGSYTDTSGHTSTPTATATANWLGTVPTTVDLAVSKTDGVTTVAAGSVDTYTITVTNSGPATVSSFNLADQIPAQLLNPVWGAPSAGSYDPTTGLWSNVSLGSGQSVSITLTGTISPAAITSSTTYVATGCGSDGNEAATATITTQNGEIIVTLTSNIANPTAAGQEISGIVFSLGGSPGSATLGSETGTLIKIAGGGAVTPYAGSITHWGLAQSGSTITLATAGTGAVGGKPIDLIIGNGPYTHANPSITGRNPQIQGTGTFVINAPGVTTGTTITGVKIEFGTGPDAVLAAAQSGSTGGSGTITNTVSVTAPAGLTDTNLSNNSASDTDTIVAAAPGIGLQKLVSVDGGNTWVAAPTASGEPAELAGGPAPEYEFVVSNTGNVALTNVTLTDTIVAGGSISLGALGNIGSLAIGATDTIVATGTWAAGQNTDTANVVGTSVINGVTSTPSASATANYFGDSPGIGLQKLVSFDGGCTWIASPTTSGEPSDQSGGPAPEYEFVVSNTGNVALTNVSLTDSVTSGGAINLGSLGNIGNLAVGATDTIVATGTWAAGQNTDVASVVGSVVANGITSTASASASANWLGTVPTTVDLAVSKTDGVTSITAGSTDTYTITVSNNGPATVTSFNLVDQIPAQLLNPVWGATSAGSYDPTTGLWSNVSLGSGESVSITLAGTISPAAGTPPTTSYTATGCGSDGNEAATATITTQNGQIIVTLTSNIANPTAAGQEISGIVFSLGGSPGAATLGSETGTLINIAGGGSVTPYSGSITHWGLAESGSTITLATAGTGAVGGKPIDLIIGNGPYTNANSSITGRNPQIQGTATFVINAPGVTAGTTISGVKIEFGTGPDAVLAASSTGSSGGGGSITNTVTVSAPAGVTDTNLSNNVASDTDTIVAAGSGAPGLTVDKVPSAMAVSSTGKEVYTFDVINTGSTALTNVQISDNIGTAANPNNITPVLQTANNGTLGVGQTWVYTATVNQSGNCTSGATSQADTVTVTAKSGSTAVTATDSTEVQVLAGNSPITLNGSTPTGSLSSLYGTAQNLEFAYNPSNTVSTQQIGIGVANGSNSNAMAFIEISNNSNPFASNASIYFEGEVQTGGKLYADATLNQLTNTPVAAPNNHFSTVSGADIYAYVFASQAAFNASQAPVQTIAYNTSGSQAMHLGDQIGSLTLVGYIGATGGHLVS